MKTVQFTFNVGVNPGYNHKNEVQDPLRIAVEIWNEQAEIIKSISGLYVGAVANVSKTVYSKEWGCPEGGEDTVVFTGLLNPKFLSEEDKHTFEMLHRVPIEAIDEWRSIVTGVCLKVAAALDQTTGYLSFSEIDFEYLQLKERNG